MMPTTQNIICNECKHEFKFNEKNMRKHWLNKANKIEEKYFICPKCKHKYTVVVSDEEIRNTIKDCNEIENEIRRLSSATTNLLKCRNSILNRAKKKSLELEKQWTKQS